MLNQIMNYGFTVAIFLLTNSMLFSTSVLAIKSKSDNGNDPCGQIDCIFLDPQESSRDKYKDGQSPIDIAMSTSNDLVEIVLNINQLTPTGNFSFPWHIRVFSNIGRELGRSYEIPEEAFQNTNESNSLRRATLEANLFTGMIYSTINMEQLIHGEPCLIDRCGEEYVNLELIFKIYSGNREVTNDCAAFTANELTPNSNVQSKIFKTCNCDDSRVEALSEEHQEFPEGNNQMIQSNTTSSSFGSLKDTQSNGGLQQKADFQLIRFYPNPAKSHLQVEHNFPDNIGAEITVLDLRGREVKKIIVYGTAISPLDLLDLATGTFILRTRIEKTINHRKVVVIN